MTEREAAIEAMMQAHQHLMFAAACNGVTVLDNLGVQETCEALHKAIEGLKNARTQPAQAVPVLTDEEIAQALPHEPGDLDMVCARAIEAAVLAKLKGQA